MHFRFCASDTVFRDRFTWPSSARWRNTSYKHPNESASEIV